MNSYNNLYEQIYQWDNIYRAYLLARKNKRSKSSTIAYELSLEQNLIILQNELIYKMFEVGQYKTFKVYEPKERIIMSLPFKDRVCQHAIINIIEPIFEQTFFTESHACRKGKGTLASVDCLKGYLKDFTKEDYYLKCDIRKFFYSMDHRVLKSILRKKIACRETLHLLFKIIDSTGDQVGLPIGNLTSQLFANIYLNELDKFVKHTLKAKYYLRYMDDFCIIHKDKEVLISWQTEIEEFLGSELKLELNAKTQINKIRYGISYLGFRNFKYHRVLRKRNWQKNKRKFKHFAKLFNEGKIDQDKINRSYQSFKGYTKWCNSYKKLTKINQIIKN